MLQRNRLFRLVAFEQPDLVIANENSTTRGTMKILWRKKY